MYIEWYQPDFEEDENTYKNDNKGTKRHHISYNYSKFTRYVEQYTKTFNYTVLLLCNIDVAYV
jgi:hypothetical protein